MTTKADLFKTIRRHCIECMGGQVSMVSGCTSPSCALFTYRLGKDPQKRAITDQERATLAARLNGPKKIENIQKKAGERIEAQG